MAASEEDLRLAHKRYDEAVKLKSAKLPELDKWYREELISVLKARGDTKEGAYLTTLELVKLMQWKLTRGKFRPRLEQMAQSNSNDLVQAQTKKAFEVVSKSDTVDTAKEALLALNVLKGIGPATSSAMLALFCSDRLPYMSDEALEFAANLKGKPKYSVTEWRWYTEQMQQRQAKEKWKGGVQQIEEAAWAYGVLVKNGMWVLEDSISKKESQARS